jgi:hypothetical protein
MATGNFTVTFGNFVTWAKQPKTVTFGNSLLKESYLVTFGCGNFLEK